MGEDEIPLEPGIWERFRTGAHNIFRSNRPLNPPPPIIYGTAGDIRADENNEELRNLFYQMVFHVKVLRVYVF